MITDQSVQALDDVLRSASPLARFSPEMEDELADLRTFLWNRMYLHPDVLQRSREGQVIIEQLCDQYMIMPSAKVLELQKRTGSALPEAIKDYVAGMTDGYASDQANSSANTPSDPPAPLR